ncbi:MAG: peptidoglycan editing factor PgeF [Nitrospinae bacterium]|nr:peptidoglycan editing factor PgeF [Nitrospinota bacterium]
MNSLERQDSGGVEFLRSPLLEEIGFLRHAFSTRRGGVSEGCFRSLNLGRARGETPDNVAENRRRFFEAADFPAGRLVEVKQVHGCEVRIADRISPGERACGDALITNASGLGLAVQTADCIPVLIADVRQTAAAAVHAGRKGVAGGVLPATIERMREEYGCDPKDMRAALGPAISGDCYEVGEECLPPFRERHRNWRDFATPLGQGKWLLDLPQAARFQLASAGVPESRIGAPGPCTFSESSRFFSYRRDGPPTGRLLSAIWIGA